jgi:hypothetical protein
MRHRFSWTCNKSRKYITKSREMEQQVRIVNKKLKNKMMKNGKGNEHDQGKLEGRKKRTDCKMLN